ncbi:MAG: sulfatase-like hydrolase/transferase, partial [Bacteroidales bacterium]|nr:sulfatase-like hydrolase/transferase [Bacteroidales bacterium]
NHFNPGEQRPGEGSPARKGRNGKKTKRAWCIDNLMFTPYTPENTDFYTTDYFTHYAIDWLEKYKDDKRPLFLYMAYTAPHDPLMAWPEDIQKYKGVYDAGYTSIREKRYKKQLEMGLINERYKLSEATHPVWDSLSNETKTEEIKKMEVYAAMIDRLDQNIGRLLKSLEETGRSKNTLIMFVSDNGASAESVKIDDDYGEIGSMTLWSSLGPNWANVSNTPFRYYKNYSYEGGINTPLLANWTGKIKPGTTSEFPGHFIDIMATYVDISRANYPDKFNGTEITPLEGVSLLPAFLDEKSERSKPLFWEWNNGQAVRVGDWKLVRSGKENSWDLYNLASDPTETKNLASDYPEKIISMDSLFFNWKENTTN